MDEDQNLFHDDELSDEDRAILAAFDSMDFSPLEETVSDASDAAITTMQPATASLLNDDDEEQFSDEDMFLTLVTEVEEDLRIMRQELQGLEPGEGGTLDAASLKVLKERAHKIKGAAAAFNEGKYERNSREGNDRNDAVETRIGPLSKIGRATDTLAGMMLENRLSPPVGLDMLARAVNVLEATLMGLVETGEEPGGPLAELEAEFVALDIDIAAGTFTRYTESERALDEWQRRIDLAEAEGRSPYLPAEMEHREDRENEASHTNTKPLQELTAGTPGRTSVRVDTARFEQLLLHAEQLIDLSSPLANAQQQVEDAMRELQAAQFRLTRLEALYSTLPLSTSITGGKNGHGYSEDRPASSLIANILDQAEVRIGHPYQRKNAKRSRHPVARPPLYWDEMEIDRYTETDVLRSSLSEAIADVATATAQLRVAFARLDTLLRQHTTRAQSVRDDTLSLRMTTLNELVGRIERAVKMNVLAQQGHLLFEAQGETTEIDQHILEELKHPLLLLVRTCLTNSTQMAALKSPDTPNTPGTRGMLDMPNTTEPESSPNAEKVWFHAQGIGSEIAIELGFSVNVTGVGSMDSKGSSALEDARESLRRLHGDIRERRNNLGGRSFHLRLPRSQGPVQGLLVRAGQHHVIVPIAQVQRIAYDNLHHQPHQSGYPASTPYTLRSLLGFPVEASNEKLPLPSLLLQHDAAHVRVEVDEIIGVIEQVVKPLPSHLRRPGISGSAIDGAGNVLLMVNLPELIRHATQRQYTLPTTQGAATPTREARQRTVLVADDSVYIRQSLLKSLREGGYRARGVPDGKVALERLQEQPPDVLLLDIEMPNLNGFDLLTIISANPQLAAVKIIMLTSRGGEKHINRALEIGAHAYLTKPCPQDTLLKTIESLLR